MNNDIYKPAKGPKVIIIRKKQVFIIWDRTITSLQKVSSMQYFKKKSKHQDIVK